MQHIITIGRSRRSTRPWAAVVTVVLAGVFAIAGMAPAQAAVQNRTLDHPLFGTGVPIPIFDTGLLVCDECIPDAFIADFDEGGAGLRISSDITTRWISKAKTDLTYTDTLLRQGSTLDLSDHLTTSDGKLTATFNVHGFLGVVVRDPDLGDNEWHETTTAIDIDVDKSFDVACDLPAPGAPPASCKTADQVKLTLIEYPILPGLVDLAVELRAYLQADVTSDGVVTVRKAGVTAGNPIDPDRTMTFAPTDDTQADPMFIGCDQPVGNDLTYSFTGTHAGHLARARCAAERLVRRPDPGPDPGRGGRRADHDHPAGRHHADDGRRGRDGQPRQRAGRQREAQGGHGRGVHR